MQKYRVLIVDSLIYNIRMGLIMSNILNEPYNETENTGTEQKELTTGPKPIQGNKKKEVN